jgi:mono/diheme cytochrome c family protein
MKLCRTSRRLLPLLAVLAAGCGFPGRPNPEDRPMPPEREVRFTVLYRENCAGCHGAAGSLGPAPPLNDPVFRAIVPDSVLENVISRGRAGTLMPAFARASGGTLTATQIQILGHEIKGTPYRIVEASDGEAGHIEVVNDAAGIAPQWGPPASLKSRAPPYLAESLKGNSNAGDKKRGAEVFARACAGCHGSHGRGGEHEGEAIGSIHDPAFLALLSNQALRRLAITGRPDLGMPNFTQKRGRSADFTPLTATDVNDLVDLLASWRL